MLVCIAGLVIRFEASQLDGKSRLVRQIFQLRPPTIQCGRFPLGLDAQKIVLRDRSVVYDERFSREIAIGGGTRFRTRLAQGNWLAAVHCGRPRGGSADQCGVCLVFPFTLVDKTI